MPFLCENIIRTWLFIMVISIVTVKVLGASGEKRFDIRIGFDLSRGANGSPSIKLQDFKDSSEVNENPDEGKHKARASSSSSSAETPIVRKQANPSSSSSKSEEDNDYNGGSRELSTRGLNAADFEPEEQHEVETQAKYGSAGDDSDKTRYRRRRKRQTAFFKDIGDFFNKQGLGH